MKNKKELFEQIKKDDQLSIEKGLKCLRNQMDEFDVQDFLDSYYAWRFDYSKDSDYTEWRSNNLFVGMSVEEISREAMETCRRLGEFGDVTQNVKALQTVPVMEMEKAYLAPTE
jgi:hypothetical protein